MTIIQEEDLEETIQLGRNSKHCSFNRAKPASKEKTNASVASPTGTMRTSQILRTFDAACQIPELLG